MPTVVPSVTEASEPALDAGLLQERKIASAGAAGVEGCFPTTSRPVSSSSTTRSVNVPPVSIPAWSATQLVPPYRGSQYSAKSRSQAGSQKSAGSPSASALPGAARTAAGRRAGRRRRPGGPSRPSASASRPRPPLLENAVAVVEVGGRLAAREAVARRGARAELLLGGAERVCASSRGTTTTPSSSPRTRSPGATATPAQVTGSPSR